MSLSIVNKDITTVSEGIIAHGVNCQAAMGSGVALAILKKWPIIYDKYMEVGAGDDLLMTTHIIPVGPDLAVANCYTQVFFGGDGKRYASLEAVDKCIRDVVRYAQMIDLPVFLPKIASDLGGLDWETEVHPTITQINKDYPDVAITVCVFP